jgi:hypothetical protein
MVGSSTYTSKKHLQASRTPFCTRDQPRLVLHSHSAMTWRSIRTPELAMAATLMDDSASAKVAAGTRHEDPADGTRNHAPNDRITNNLMYNTLHDSQ